MTAPAFQLHHETPGTLAVSGVLSFANAATAWQAIAAALAASPLVRMDLAGVEHSDSAGLACVLAAQAEAQRLGRTLAVDHLPAGMRTLAQVCEVDSLIG